MIFAERALILSLSCIFTVAAGTTLPAVLQAAPPSKISWEPPPSITPPMLSRYSGSNVMISELRVGSLIVTLEKTPLTLLQSHFGGSIGHRGDAGESLSWLCLTGSNSGKRSVLWLKSSEIDAGTVGGFRWEAVAVNEGIDHRCGQVRESEGEIRLELPLALRTPSDDLSKVLGPASVSRQRQFLFAHEQQELVANRPFTVTNSVSVLVRHGLVWAIEVWKSTTS
jgi:hypothetical protein